MMKRKISWLFAFLISTQIFGQEFQFESPIEAVNDSGYYRVVLSPELLGQVRNGLADLRIYNELGEEQPYLVRREKSVESRSLFTPYEIIDKAYKEDAISHLIFENPDKKAIDNVSFLVKNTDVKKRARLSGSDDQQNWYVIKDNYLLHAMYSDSETTEMKILNFPLSDYRYFKLEINDNWKLPINILQVGYYDRQQIRGVSSSFTCPRIEQKDSAKRSYVKMMFPKPMYMEQFQFAVSGADYYSRYGALTVKRTRLDKKKKSFTHFESLGSLNLNSNSNNQMEFSGISGQEFLLEIDNRDDQPIKIDSVKASYLNKYVVVRLLPSSSYKIQFGDEKLRRPSYDLKAFADQIPQGIPKVRHGKVINIIEEEEEKIKSSWWNNKYLVWFVIAVVGFGLTYISLKMVKEMGG